MTYGKEIGSHLKYRPISYKLLFNFCSYIDTIYYTYSYVFCPIQICSCPDFYFFNISETIKAIYSTRWVKDLETRARDCKSCFHKYKNSKISKSILHFSDESISLVYFSLRFYFKPRNDLVYSVKMSFFGGE